MHLVLEVLRLAPVAARPVAVIVWVAVPVVSRRARPSPRHWLARLVVHRVPVPVFPVYLFEHLFVAGPVSAVVALLFLSVYSIAVDVFLFVRVWLVISVVFDYTVVSLVACLFLLVFAVVLFFSFVLPVVS